MVKYRISSLATSIIILVAFPFWVTAQSKHTAMWRLGDYCLDFNSNPPELYLFNYSSDITFQSYLSLNWYIDDTGKLMVIIYDSDGIGWIYNNTSNQFEKIITDY